MWSSTTWYFNSKRFHLLSTCLVSHLRTHMTHVPSKFHFWAPFAKSSEIQSGWWFQVFLTNAIVCVNHYFRNTSFLTEIPKLKLIILCMKLTIVHTVACSDFFVCAWARLLFFFCHFCLQGDCESQNIYTFFQPYSYKSLLHENMKRPISTKLMPIVCEKTWRMPVPACQVGLHRSC